MKMFLGGEWVDREERIEVRDPLDDSLIDTVPSASLEDVGRAVSTAVDGFGVMRNMPTHRKIDILYRTAGIVESGQEEFARIIARESSKTIREARREVSRAINTLTISAEEARRTAGETLPFDSFPGDENRLGYYARVPIGIIVAITPFNDPLNLVAHKLGPAFAGGNAVILKPATITPLSGLKLGEAFFEAGLPAQALSILTGHGHVIGDALVADPRVRMISFTGGTEAGLEITRRAGLKKIGMELGSNSPVIVMDDCDLDRAVELSVSGAFWAAGQNCIGVQRIYVHKAVYAAFKDRFVERTNEYKIGDKMSEDTDMGPVIAEKEAERIVDWVNEAIREGAGLLTGGKREGTLVEPTVLEETPGQAKLSCDEVFGPVVSLYRVDNLEEAVQKSNGGDYGLHAAIFTRDINNAFYAVRHLEAGGIMVNDSTDYRLDMMPFGGIKQSGLGREGIKFALQEMTEPKVVCFNL
ncbi:MAG: aldehyde dehydrogenase family protein [Fidelibacterota bacterium]